jgi:hypothetical protein
VFATADKNGDGYLDGGEYTHPDMAHGSKPNDLSGTGPAGKLESDTEKPRQ